jgi:pyroglutamyl-peptidase
MQMHKGIIVTGFEPFSKFPINSSWESTKAVKEMRSDIVIKELTVDYMTAHQEVTALLIDNPCETILLMGLADKPLLNLEIVAHKPKELAHLDGPSVLVGDWPWTENLLALLESNLPARLSTDAGKYVCESTYWSALNFKLNHGYPSKIAFLHMPVISDEWPVDRLAKATLLSIDLISISSV